MSDAAADQEQKVDPTTEDVPRAGKIDTFTIETFVPSAEEDGEECNPWMAQPRSDSDEKLITTHTRNGQTWQLVVTIKPSVDYDDYESDEYGEAYSEPAGYVLELKPPSSLPEGATVKWKPYEKTSSETRWTEVGAQQPLGKSTVDDPIYVGVSVTVTYANWRSKWDFLTAERMASWDVAFIVNAKRFYAHRLVKHEKEVPLEEVDPDLFEAFLHCVYPCGSDPPEGYLLSLTYLADKFGADSLTLKCHEALKWTSAVSNVDKLQAAVKTTAPTLEDHVIQSLTVEDIKELVGSDVMNELGEERLAKILKKSAVFI